MKMRCSLTGSVSGAAVLNDTRTGPAGCAMTQSNLLVPYARQRSAAVHVVQMTKGTVSARNARGAVDVED